MPLQVEYFNDVHGYISWPEAQLLYTLATQLPPNGKVVEIGSYQARSTIALATGAKEVGGMVWAIDHHPTYEQGGTQFGMGDNQAYYGNIADYGVGDVVRTVNLPSDQAFIAWKDDIDLLFIDGDHDAVQVQRDWYLWSMLADVVAMHDTAGFHNGINKLVQDILDSGAWERTEMVDSISVFRRVG